MGVIINTSGSSVRRKNDPVDYIYIYLLSLATPALLGLRSASSLSYKSPGSTGRITHLSLGVASEGASGLYAGSSHIRPANISHGWTEH